MYHMHTEMPAKTWNCWIYNTSLFSIIDVEVLRSFVTRYYCIGNHSDSVYVKLINFQIIPRGNTSVHWMNLLGGTHGIMVKGILSLKGLVSRDIVCKDNEPTTVAHIDNGFPVALTSLRCIEYTPGSAFIKPDQLDPWIKDQIKITLLSTIAPLQLPNFVSCGRDKPSHMTQNLVTVGATLWTAEYFLVDPWSMDQADLVW